MRLSPSAMASSTGAHLRSLLSATGNPASSSASANSYRRRSTATCSTCGRHASCTRFCRSATGTPAVAIGTGQPPTFKGPALGSAHGLLKLALDSSGYSKCCCSSSCSNACCRDMEAKAHRVALGIKLPLSLGGQRCQQLQRSACVAFKRSPAPCEHRLCILMAVPCALGLLVP